MARHFGVCERVPPPYVQRRTRTGPTAIPWLHRLAIRVVAKVQSFCLASRCHSRPRSHAMPTEAQGLDDPKLPWRLSA
jgi:hypothetical protein